MIDSVIVGQQELDKILSRNILSHDLIKQVKILINILIFDLRIVNLTISLLV